MKNLEIPNDSVVKKDWEELERDILVRLKNDIILVEQRLVLLELCRKRIAEFPVEVIEAPEAKEAVAEIENKLEHFP